MGMASVPSLSWFFPGCRHPEQSSESHWGDHGPTFRSTRGEEVVDALDQRRR